MDSLYWNSTLRLGSHDSSKSARDSVYSNGLVLLSVEGNQIGGDNLRILSKAIERNHWIIGINLADNNLSASEVANVVKAILSHSSLLAARLDGNPGYSTKTESVICTSMAHSTVDKSTLDADVSLLLSSWSPVTGVDDPKASPVLELHQYDAKTKNSLQIADDNAGSRRSLGAYSRQGFGSIGQAEAFGEAGDSYDRQPASRPPSRNSLRPPRAHLSEKGSPVHIPLALMEDASRPPQNAPSLRPSTSKEGRRPSSAPSFRSTARPTAVTQTYGIGASVKKIDKDRHISKSTQSTPSSRRKKKRASSEKKLLDKLSNAVGTMSENLEIVASQLREVTGTLAKSVELQRSTQKELNGSLVSANRAAMYSTPRMWTGTSDIRSSGHGAALIGPSDDDDDDKLLSGIIRRNLRKKLESILI